MCVLIVDASVFFNLETLSAFCMIVSVVQYGFGVCFSVIL